MHARVVWMRSIAADGVAWSVYLCVCVGHYQFTRESESAAADTRLLSSSGPGGRPAVCSADVSYFQRFLSDRQS